MALASQFYFSQTTSVTSSFINLSFHPHFVFILTSPIIAHRLFILNKYFLSSDHTNCTVTELLGSIVCRSQCSPVANCLAGSAVRGIITQRVYCNSNTYDRDDKQMYKNEAERYHCVLCVLM